MADSEGRNRIVVRDRNGTSTARKLQLREEDWMPACNATYKLAVRFENWRAPGPRARKLALKSLGISMRTAIGGK